MVAEIPAKIVRSVLHDDYRPALVELSDVTLSSWAEVVPLAVRWGILPLFYTSLHEKGLLSMVPDKVGQRLRALYHASFAQSNHLFMQQLPPLLQPLNRAGIPVMALKGIHLADKIYAGRSLRPMSDVDLLMPASALPKVAGIMQAQGYIAATVANDCHIHYRHADRQVLPVEIHWTVQSPQETALLDVAAFWQRSRQTMLTGVPVQVMDAEDLLIYLCWHVAKHLYRTGLRALCDVRAVVCHFGKEIEWSAVSARSRAWNVQRPVFLTLRLMEELLGTAVSRHALQALQPAAYHPQLLQWAAAEILEQQPPLTRNLLKMLHAPDRQRRWSALRYTLFPPATYMQRTYGGAFYYHRRWADLWRRYGRIIRSLLRPESAARKRVNLFHWLQTFT